MSPLQKSSLSVLILENDSDLADCIRLYLEDSYQVYVTQDAANLEGYVSKYKINLIITDLDSPYPNLREQLKNIKRENPQVKIIVIYMFLDDEEQKERSILKEADDYIFKPFDADVLKFKLNKLISPFH
jgi:DNA-binding response OmpR family regulator